MAAKILVPLDGRPESEAAVQEALGLLRRRRGGDTTLILLRAVEPPADGVEPSGLAVAAAGEYLREIAEDLRQHGLGLIRRSVWYAAAGPAIVELARTAKPDLIVMRNPGDRERRRTRGDVVRYVRERLDIPLVLVHADGHRAGPAVRRAA